MNETIASLARALTVLGALPLALPTSCPSAVADGLAERWSPPSEAGLPDGFPAPSEPGRVLLKWYPEARGAFVRVEGSFDSASFRGFWPLFRHIKRESIAMTAPVLSEYEGDVRVDDQGPMSMAFLYPSAAVGRQGRADSSNVRVADMARHCVVSVGVEGPYDLETMRTALAQLDGWLAENGGTWRAAGPPRRLSYQQPLPWKRLYAEVQIPVTPVPLAPERKG